MPDMDAPPPGDALTDTMVMIDGPTIDGPPGDTDADGVPNNTDNCPGKPNVDQHDEDADAIGDVCDPCPHMAGNAADGDNDGVGDACDPAPNLPKQTIKFFDPFTSDLPQWNHLSNTARSGETLRLNGASIAQSRLAVGNGESRIYVGGTIVSTGNTARQLSVEFGMNAGFTVYHYCEFYDSGGNSIEITKANNGSYDSLASTSAGGSLPTGAWSMQIDESVAGQQIRLVAKVGGTTYAPMTGNTSTAPALTASNMFELYVTRADVRVDYFLVIETMP